MDDVLCLATNYMPLDRLSWRDALHRVITGRAEVLEEYDDVTVHLATGDIPLPAVIRFKHMAKMVFTRGVKFNRKNVWLRDGHRCQYCGRIVALDDFTYDHVIPKDQGGQRNWDNIVTSCLSCNLKKRNRTPAEAGMILRTKPVCPKFLPGQIAPSFVLGKGEHIPETWKDYLASYRYWCQPIDTAA